ncbi:MAG TPA: hypothetical protein VGC66_17375 [Pyrinomonadaceae bacterium]
MARGHDERIHETPDASDIRNPDITHEVSDVNTRAILWFVLFLAGLIVVSLLLLRGMFNLFESWAKTAEGDRPVMARTEQERLPPDPKLQGAPGFKIKDESPVLTEEDKELELKGPQAERKAVNKVWDYQLKNYGWVDRENGLVSIPIEEAIKKIARDGIKPVKPQSSNQQQQQQAGQTPGAQVPSDSSSGRQTERKQP